MHLVKRQPFKVNTSKLNSIDQSSYLKTNKGRSIISSITDQILQLSQSQIHFVNTQINELYEVTLSVRNVSQNSQKIKIKKPLSPYLNVTSSRDGVIAAGLQFKIVVVFDSKENLALNDKIVIYTDNTEIELPIKVSPQIGKLQYDPFVNFGFIKIGETREMSWQIKNSGESVAQVKLIPYLIQKNAKITILPEQFLLEPNEKKILKMIIYSSVAGTIQGTIEIEPKNLNYISIEFVANFCEFSQSITDAEGNPLHNIQLPSLIAGQKTKVTAYIVNNTPNLCEYRVTKKKGCSGQDLNNLITPEQIGRDDTEKLMAFTPAQGELEPYSSAELKISIQAKFDQSDIQTFCNYISGKHVTQKFERQWTYSLKTLMGTDHQINLNIKGVSIIPKIGLSQTYLQFGTCSLKSKSQKSLKVENFSAQPVTLQFENSANYSFAPKNITLSQNSNCKIIVVFHPKIVGQLNQICCLTLGQFSFPIKMLGKSVFNKSKIANGLETGRIGEEVPIEQIDQTMIEEQISMIHKIKKINTFSLNDTSKNTIHFDTYRQNHAQSIISDKSLIHHENKRSKVLKNKNGGEAKVDINHLNPNQPVDHYPNNPKNQQEKRLVSRQLTSEQLKNIIVGPVIIDIGNIFLRSVVKKSFHICNFNQKSISISLETNHESFAETLHDQQILPGESHGGFNIIFEALTEGNFKHTIQYILNGNHFFEILVKGVCILPTISLSKSQIKFIASEQDKTFDKKESIKLDNTYEYDVEYEWKASKDNLFMIEPMNGVIKAHSSINTFVTHNFKNTPQIGVKFEQSLKLKIKYGKVMDLKCSAYVPESHCICKSSEINFKQISVGKPYENKIFLKNCSKNFTIYQVQLSKDIENLVTVNPKIGTIAGDEITQISFKIISLKGLTIDSNVQIFVRGSKTIEIPLKANIILPKVKIENQEIDFGSIPVDGNAAEKQVTLVNESSIAVDLELKLHNQTFLAKYFRLAKINDDNMVVTEVKELKTMKIICFRINPKCKSSFILQFLPETTEQYQFYLPLFLPNSQPLDELQRLCKCKGIKNRLSVSEKQINFGKIIIEHVDQIYNKCYSIELKNPHEEPIEWWIGNENLQPFKIDKNRGRLLGFERITLNTFFVAENPGEFNGQINFFIDTAETDISRCYLKVILKATACYPTIYFDQPYVIMPVVRLNQESTAVFEITNGGYQNINLKHSVVQQFSNIDLKIKYVNGSNLGVTKKQIKVEVSFISDKPISFTLKVNFYDNSNRCFSINVSGTADNCTYTFVDLDLKNANYSYLVDKSCSFLKNYINNIGFISDEIYEFPKSLCQNQFEKFHLFISNYSISFEKVKEKVKKNCKTFFSFQYISQVIKIAKSEGAFLNHIRPEMLLTYEEYCENIKIRAEENATVLSYYKCFDKNLFEVEQKKSWVVLFYQIFKIYSRVNAGKLKNGSQFWTKFGIRQKILLNWLQKTYQEQANIDLQSKGNQILSTLNNGEILSALISKYTNIKILDFYNKPVKGAKDKEKRCRSVIETFNQIGINCIFRVEDLMRSNEKQMLLIIENLYLILPSYLQKGEPIVFSCSFGQIVTKSVQITNPSKYPITYFAKIEGSKAYSIENQSQFTIQSKKTHEVKIKYVSNINISNSSATLTLTGKASAKFTPSTFIFVLKNVTLGRISQKSIQVTTNIYEQLQFPVKVTNNFSHDADFKIQMANSTKNPYNTFYLLNNSIKIKKGETSQINMVFIPFLLDTQHCNLIFRDDKVGQFQYQVVGLVENNILCQQVLRIPQVLYTNKRYFIQLPLPTKNDLIFRARKAAQLLADRLQKKTFLNGKILTNNYDKYYPKLTQVESFTAKLTTPNNSIILKSENVTIKDMQINDENIKRDDQKLAFEINLKSAIKDGTFTVNLKNANGTDLRRYKIVVNAIARPLRYQLEIKTPANKSISQPLPLINITNDQNLFFVTLIPSNQLSKPVFSIDCEKEMTVEAKEQSVVNLMFKPKSQNIFNALLKIQNLTTGQNVEYQLVGVAQEPEAQCLIFDQQIRKEKTHNIKLPYLKSGKYSVQSFSLEGAVYQKVFSVTPDTPSFKFKYLSKTSGKFQGKLILEEQQKIHAFKIVINVRRVIEGEIKMRTVERKEAITEILLNKGTYKIINSEYNLKCPNEIEILDENGSLPVTYYSSKPEEKEIQLVLIHNQIGQLVYLIKVIVDPMPQIRLQSFQVELSKIHYEKIVFQNTDSTQMIVTSKSTLPLVFHSELEIIKVPPRSTITTNIIYKASSLEMEEAKIYFVSDKNAKWTYHLSGYGLPQSKPEVKEMTVNMGEHTCESISFINPLSKNIQVVVTLQNLNNEQTFSSILKTNKIDLAYNQQLQIPITIKPKSVYLSKAILKVTVNQKIFWRYELQAKVYFKSIDEPKYFKIPIRTKQDQQIQFSLPQSHHYQNKKVELKILALNEGTETMLKNCIKILNNAVSPVQNGKVTYNLNILSFKPKNVNTSFQIIAQDGCKWTYKCDFSFLPSLPDDRFQIIASINKPSSVKFKLTNRTKQYAKFNAYFTADSCIDFTVNPKNGELEPYGREGTPIQVIFCPTEYKKSWAGKLIIESEDGYWSYDVKGCLPHYNPPIGKSNIRQ